MKKLTIALLSALMSLSVFAQDESMESTEAPAEEESSLITGALTFASDYRFRGITQTNDDPALQIGLEAALGAGFYAGLWASNTDFKPLNSATYELDTIVGWRGNITDDVATDVQWVRYNYLTDNPSGLEYNELIGKVSFMGFTGLLGYTDNFLASDEDGIYYNLAYGFTVAETYNVSAALGYYDIDLPSGDSSSYSDTSIGVSRTFGNDLTVGLSYVRTNKGIPSLFAGLGDSRFVFTMGTTFGLF